MSDSLDFTDTRGGTFYVIAGKRVHESDLTARQRKALELPPLPAPSTTDVTTDA